MCLCVFRGYEGGDRAEKRTKGKEGKKKCGMRLCVPEGRDREKRSGIEEGLNSECALERWHPKAWVVNEEGKKKGKSMISQIIHQPKEHILR